MRETWDVSALIDKGTRIHEARGMTMQHLGMELRRSANRAFIVSPQTHVDLEAEFDQITLNDAYDGIASRTGVGEYLLVRDRELSSGALLTKLGTAAESRSTPQSQLRLETSSLQLSVLGPNLNCAGIRRAADYLRHPDRPAREWEGVVMVQPFWLRPAVFAAGVVAIPGVAWLAI